MDYYLILMITTLVSWVIYRWYKENVDTEKKLRWVPIVPGVPLLGNVLEFKNSTDFLKVFMRYVAEYKGMCQMSLMQEKFLVTADHNFLKFILTTTDILNKSASYRFLERWLGQGLILADGAKSKWSRKFLTPAFHFKILEEFVDVFDFNSDTLIKILEERADGVTTFDIYPYITNCTLDIICESTMGVSLNAQIDTKSDYVKAVKELCRIEVDRTFSPFKMYDCLYPFSRDYYKEKKYVKILHKHANFVIKTRKAKIQRQHLENTEQNDDVGAKKKLAFLDLMLKARVNGMGLTDQEICDEVNTFMFAGHDTTSSAIGFTLYCLATNPLVQAVAVKEQRTLFSNNRNKTVTHSDLQKMKYLDMTIMEALRLYPSVPFVGRLTNKEVAYEAGKVIPKNIGIIIFIFGVNRNPQVFPDPENFNPHRFDSDVRKYTPYDYIPFSAGPRNCIGQKYAMLEMKAVVSKILRNFVLLPSGKTPILAAETVLKSTNGIQLKLKKREW